MKKILLAYLLPVLLLGFISVSFVACGDDDDDVILSSYIIGKWHSYKFVGYYQQEEIILEVEKNGAYSVSYFELEFEKNAKVIMYGWQQDQHGLSTWASEMGTYTINGNTVIISSDDTDEDSLTLMFDEKSKELYVRAIVQNESSIPITAYLFLKK